VIPTGCSSLDEQLGGGLIGREISLLYGEPGTGKTSLSIQCAVNCARMGYKAFFIDCDNGFLSRRMEQVAPEDCEDIASRIILMRPEDFEQQATVIDKLNDYISDETGLVIIDTVTSLYRERLGAGIKETFALNRELNRQMGRLAQTIKTRETAGLVVSQVRSVILGEQGAVQPVATRVLHFWSDTIVFLEPTSQGKLVKAIVEKHRERKRIRPILLEIEERGLCDYEG
jgi:RecA/RadA recombinase